MCMLGVFVAGIHLSGTWMLRPFAIHAMVCMCAQTRPQFILWSERVLGSGVRTHVNSKRKIPPPLPPPLLKALRSVEAATLHPTGQRAQHTTDWGLPAPDPTSDLNMGTLVAPLPAAWQYSTSTWTGWPRISVLWLGEMVSVICSLCLGVVACPAVWADLSLRCTLPVAGMLTLNFPVSVVKILISKIYSKKDWQENGWILFWKFKIKGVSYCRWKMKSKLSSKLV